MRHTMIVIGVVAAGVMATWPHPVLAQTPTTLDKPAVYQAINDYRVRLGLSPLSADRQLEAAADAKLGDMQTKDYWAHYGPGGEDPWQFIDETGYDYDRAGENLAIRYTDEDALIQAWKDSPPHDRLLRGDYADVGIAIGRSEIPHQPGIVVAMFAQPRTDIRDELLVPSLDYVTRIEYDFWYPLRMLPVASWML